MWKSYRSHSRYSLRGRGNYDHFHFLDNECNSGIWTFWALQTILVNKGISKFTELPIRFPSFLFSWNQMLDLPRTSKKWTRLETSRVAVLSSVFVYSSATFANPVDRNQSIVSTTKHWSNLHKYFRFHLLMQMLLTGFLINGWPKPMRESNCAARNIASTARATVDA